MLAKLKSSSSRERGKQIDFMSCIKSTEQTVPCKGYLWLQCDSFPESPLIMQTLNLDITIYLTIVKVYREQCYT